MKFFPFNIFSVPTANSLEPTCSSALTVTETNSDQVHDTEPDSDQSHEPILQEPNGKRQVASRLTLSMYLVWFY